MQKQTWVVCVRTFFVIMSKFLKALIFLKLQKRTWICGVRPVWELVEIEDHGTIGRCCNHAHLEFSKILINIQNYNHTHMVGGSLELGIIFITIKKVSWKFKMTYCWLKFKMKKKLINKQNGKKFEQHAILMILDLSLPQG